MNITFSIPGQPVAKGRPKFARRGANVVAYTPAKTASYENLVKMAASIAMNGGELSACPIAMDITLYMQIPESWSQKKRTQAICGEVMPTKKPDADNVLKGIKDGCNAIVWRDDSQVVSITLTKSYSLQPSARVTIWDLPGRAA